MNLSSWDFLWHSFLRKGAAQRNEELISQFSLTQLNKRHRSSISLRRQSRSFPQLHLGRRSSRRDKSSNSGSFSMITRRSTFCPASSEALPTASISVKNSNTSTLCGSSRFTPSPKKSSSFSSRAHISLYPLLVNSERYTELPPGSLASEAVTTSCTFDVRSVTQAGCNLPAGFPPLASPPISPILHHQRCLSRHNHKHQIGVV